MKALAALSLALFLAGASNALAQTTAQDPTDLAVLKYSWSKERIGWERDPFSPPVESNDEMRIRQRDEKRIEDAKRSGSGSELNRAERDARADAAIKERLRQKAPPRYAYRYKVSIKNTGTKTVKAIDWDYIFFDPNAQIEIGRHQFTSEEKIRPGKSEELDVVIISPPTKTISADALSNEKRPPFDERIVLIRIEYSDGTFWQRQ